MNRAVLLLWFLLIQHVLLAQYPGNLHSISRSEGLSNGAVNTIALDKEGYLWFGTWNGLNRYDGSNITTFMPGAKPFAIHNHVIRELYPTNSGEIWMLTNKGIALYDNTLDRFTAFFNNESDQINYENDISLTQSEKSGVIAAVYGKGIFKYDTASKQFQKLIFEGPSINTSLEIKRIHIIGNDIFCISSSSVMLKISGNRLDQILLLPLKSTLSTSYSAVMGNRPYLFITQREGDALMIDIEGNSTVKLSLPDDIITSFGTSRTTDRIWVGSEKGKVCQLNTVTNELEVLNRSFDHAFNNPISARILSLYEMAPDILWVGSDGNGAFQMKLSEFPNKIIPSKLLAYPIVRSILVTKNKHVLIGTKGGGIDIFSAEGNHIKTLSIKDGLSNNSVLSFLERVDGTIWVGTDGRGIDIISPDYKTIKNFPRDYFGSDEPFFASVYRIIEDKGRRLILGTSGYGVIMVDFDPGNPSIPVSHEQIILDKNSGGQQKQIVYAITTGKPGVIWIGTRGFGVYKYNTITKRVLSLYNTTTHPSVIKNDDILALFTDDNGNIWSGSSAGIFSLAPAIKGNDKVTSLNLQYDFSSTSIHAIQIDNSRGSLWVTTNQGLLCIDIGLKTVKSFTTNDGLVNLEYSDGASFYDEESGSLYVGGTMGVDVIRTDKILFSSYFPPIAINDFLIRNLPVGIGKESILQNRINLQPNLELHSYQNTISFNVSPLVYWGKERHRISYRLRNFDDNWMVKPSNQFIAFANLRPGNYTLQLRVSDENGNWAPYLREIEITINPPIYLTKWAIALYVLLIIGIQGLVIRAYLRRQSIRKEAELLELTQQKEKQLQNYKLEFFTNVAHEFRTPLTLITSHIHMLMEEEDAVGKNPRLLKVYNNSIKLQKLVLEIIQFRKLEKGKEPLNISRVDPLTLAGEVISDLEPLIKKYDVQCAIIGPDSDVHFNTDADKFQRIVTNLVSNAIKYSPAGSAISVSIAFQENELILKVEDSGIGINPEFKSKVFEPFGLSSAQKRGSFPDYKSTGLGLAVTKGIVELLGGTITYESRFGEGTTFSCKFPNIHIVRKSDPVQPVEHVSVMALMEESIYEDVLTDDILPNLPNLLIVDDDVEILELLNEMFRLIYNLYFARNGNEALILLQNHKIDLVISDVMMPEMDGIELCDKLRENFDTSHLPLILLTAKSEIEDRIVGLQAGADSYIPKPFHPEHLKVRVEKLLESRKHIKSRFANHEEPTLLFNSLNDPFFKKLINFIDENIDDESLITERICDKLGISKSSLYNKTKSVLGSTPHGLINQRRVRKASILLDSTSLTVSEIIDQTGFKSRAHFYELFNKAYHCTPSEYRQKQKSTP